VAAVVKSIPPGRVLAYAQVANRAGTPGAARAVVRALHGIHGAGVQIPWWRVVRADRTLAAPVAARQAALLRREGVRVTGRRLAPEPPVQPVGSA